MRKVLFESSENKRAVNFIVYYRRELEQRLRELKRRKKEKKIVKLREFEEERERDKKKWTDFNSKVR